MIIWTVMLVIISRQNAFQVNLFICTKQSEERVEPNCFYRQLQ